MPETYSEQLSRVRLMAAGDETWDLSDNDQAALKAVLAHLPTPEVEQGYIEAKTENTRLRAAIRNQNGDNFCWKGADEEGKALTWDQMQESCKRFHTQLVGLVGIVPPGSMTIAQLEAECENLNSRIGFLEGHSLAAYVKRQQGWSTLTFGPGLRTEGVTKHIEKELAEIRKEPADLFEWIDVVILALDGYWRAGGEPEQAMWYLQSKQSKNFARKWPQNVPEDQPVEHIKEPTNADA